MTGDELVVDPSSDRGEVACTPLFQKEREEVRLEEEIAELVAHGYDVVITHGSGPQVGFILRRSEIALGEVPPVPMDYAAADLQGSIGYMFQRALYNEFRRRGLKRKVVAVVTQVLVDRNDPALANPTKPIGAHMDREVAESLSSARGGRHFPAAADRHRPGGARPAGRCRGAR